MKKRFEPIYHSPFGNRVLDERATHEAFEDYMGGVDRAFRILHVWQDSYNSLHKFEIKAAREGFTENEIDAFLSL